MGDDVELIRQPSFGDSDAIGHGFGGVEYLGYCVVKERESAWIRWDKTNVIHKKYF